MRSIAAPLAVSLACVAAGLSHGQTADAPAEPVRSKTYALIGAVGEEFTTVSETAMVGTHLSPYRRTTERVPDNILNRLAPHSLDRAIAADSRSEVIAPKGRGIVGPIRRIDPDEMPVPSPDVPK